MMIEIKKGEPIVLPDGTMILPEANASGSKVVTAQERQEQEVLDEITREIQEDLADPFENTHNMMRRTLGDISVPFAQMNVTMLCVSYHVWGLEDHAIARILNTDPDNVNAIINSDVGIKLRQELVEAMRHAEASTVHGYLSQKARDAARVVAASLKSTSADVRVSAAKDILDRAGFRPADRVEHVHKFEDELRIRYVQDTAHIPTIDLEVEN